MKYINANTLINFNDIKKGHFAWLLLGNPVGHVSLELDTTANGNYSWEPGYSGQEKRMIIKDYSIAGISFVNIKEEIGENLTEDGESLTITFPSSGGKTYIFCKVGNNQADRNGFNNVGCLALVKIKDSIWNTIYDSNLGDYIENEVRGKFFYFNQEERNNSEYTFVYKHDATPAPNTHTRIMGMIDSVLVVYSVVNSENTPVNFINYTGFSVGESVLSINGLKA